MLQWQQIVVNCKAVTNQIAYNYELHSVEEPTSQPIQKNLTMATPFVTQLTDNIQYVSQSQADVLSVLHKWRLFTNMQHFCLLPSTRNTRHYPNSVSMPIFPGEADWPFILYNLKLSRDWPKLFITFWTPSYHVSTSGICNRWSIYHHFSIILQCLIQSVSSLRLTCPKQFNLSILITKLLLPSLTVPRAWQFLPFFQTKPTYQSILVLTQLPSTAFNTYHIVIVYVYSYSNSSYSNSHVA